MSVFQQFEGNKNKIDIYTHTKKLQVRRLRKYNGKKVKTVKSGG